MSASHRSYRLCLFTALLSLSAASPALGQGEKGEKADRIQAEGKLLAAAQGIMKLETEEGEIWFVKLEESAKNSRVVGSAEPGWLRPGMIVRFDAKFNSKGQPLSAVSQLTVFTPGKDDKAGVEIDKSLGADFSFAEDKPQPKGEKPISATVVGAIRGIRGNQLSVAAGRIPVTVPLAESLSVSVDVADLRLARLGDKVSIRGRKVGPDKAIAQWVKISAAEPFTAGGKKSAGGKNGTGGQKPNPKAPKSE